MADRYYLTEETQRDLHRIIRKVDSIRGPRVNNTREDIAIGDTPVPPAETGAGNYFEGLFPVNLSKTSGSQGTKTAAATWVYTVTTLGGIQLATNQGTVPSRPNGTCTIATQGWAWRDGSTLYVHALEVYGTGAC